MIITTADPYWIWSVPRIAKDSIYRNEEERLQHSGKWVVLGDKAYI